MRIIETFITDGLLMGARSSTPRAIHVDQLAFVFEIEAQTAMAPASILTPPKVVSDRVSATRPSRALSALRPKPKLTIREATLPKEERRLTVGEAAEVLSVSVKTLEAWRRLGKGPMFVKLGRSVRYTMQALDAFTHERTVRNSAEGRLLDRPL